MITKQLIHKLGGMVVVGNTLGIDPGVVSNWHKRGVPWHWRPAVAELAAEKGVEVPTDFLITDRKMA